ncbi:MAG: V-type ATP synthase subunit E [Sphaerochaeta sp.]|jgi:V/A-type H+-transporting ATPase subunit E|nr:V-type ATP synthase subunit E [Sphaerochaeta sp.]MDX9914337.1 V-type ATP synthase subunit E [Sphaerochaeta sp.]
MAQQIQELVASIRKDGIEVAQQEANEIVEAARKEAARVVAEAKKERDSLLLQAEREIATKEASARASLAQASRDVQISLKDALTAQLDRLLVDTVTKALSSKDVVDLITKVVELSGESHTKVLELNKKEFDALAESLKGKLAGDLKNGLEIKPVPSVDGGFKLAEKDGTSFFDFSAPETAALLKPYLSHAIEALIFN